MSMNSDTGFRIERTTIDDLAFIKYLFDASVAFQEENGYPSWRHYDMNAIREDILHGNQHKIVSGDTIAIVFSIIYEDPVIWRHHENGNAVYLHRIVVNPAFKGQKMLARIISWAGVHGRQQGRQLIRMDTWAANARLINYYKGFGFRHVENYTTPDTEAIPSHNRNLNLALLEMNIL